MSYFLKNLKRENTELQQRLKLRCRRKESVRALYITLPSLCPVIHDDLEVILRLHTAVTFQFEKSGSVSKSIHSLQLLDAVLVRVVGVPEQTSTDDCKDLIVEGGWWVCHQGWVPVSLSL